MLGTLSKYNFVASKSLKNPTGLGTAEAQTWCMTLPAQKFMKYCDQFPYFRSFVLMRGI